MRASSDVFIVGLTSLGTALFLAQLLIVSQQIASADYRLKGELKAEKMALPVMHWPFMGIPKATRQYWWEARCCYPLSPLKSRATVMVQPDYPIKALLQRKAGFVDIGFTLMPDGSVANPAVTGEQPAGYGLAEAVMKVFPGWKFDTAPGAVAVDASYRITFRPEQVGLDYIPPQKIP